MALEDDDIVRQIIKAVNISLDEYTNKLALTIKGPILIKIRENIGQVIRASPEYIRLKSNTSEHHQFGIPNIEYLMDAVIDRILNDIGLNIRFVRRGGKSNPYYSGTFTIKLLDTSYKDILAMPEAQFVYEKESGIINYGRVSSGILPWLEWLLLEGTNPVILYFHYYGLLSDASRTNLGLMFHKGTWSVPANIAGTRENNWLTRAINSLSSDLPLIVEQEFRKNV